jgi:hypothetical protein
MKRPERERRPGNWPFIVSSGNVTADSGKNTSDRQPASA